MINMSKFEAEALLVTQVGRKFAGQSLFVVFPLLQLLLFFCRYYFFIYSLFSIPPLFLLPFLSFILIFHALRSSLDFYSCCLFLPQPTSEADVSGDQSGIPCSSLCHISLHVRIHSPWQPVKDRTGYVPHHYTSMAVSYTHLTLPTIRCV